MIDYFLLLRQHSYNLSPSGMIQGIMLSSPYICYPYLARKHSKVWYDFVILRNPSQKLYDFQGQSGNI